MANIWTRTFWRATGERVLSTALEAAIPSFTVSSLSEVDWWMAGSITGSAALLSLFKNVLSGLKTGTPSLSPAEVLSQPGQTGESSEAGPVVVEPDQPNVGAGGVPLPGKHAQVDDMHTAAPTGDEDGPDV